jgi:exopolyphosphatase/guanosine-5'-triphosphate,3'-diphosphate pyrophosphatase
MLARAARLHEIGLALAHSSYHVHGAYVLANSDIAGFSQQEQRFVAVLVRTQRRNVPKTAFEMMPDRLLAHARRSAALLRLAVLLHRSRDGESLPSMQLRADGDRLTLSFAPGWLQTRPLLRADLEGEVEDMRGLGMQLLLGVE